MVRTIKLGSAYDIGIMGHPCRVFHIQNYPNSLSYHPPSSYLDSKRSRTNPLNETVANPPETAKKNPYASLRAFPVSINNKERDTSLGFARRDFK